MNLDKSKWTKVKLGDVVIKKEENDRENAHKRFDRFLKVEHMDAESLHIKRWSSQKDGDQINPTFYKIFREGQVLFPTRNPHLRRTALATFDGICGEKTLTLEPDETQVLSSFIPFLFHSDVFYAHTTSSIIGSTNPHCRWRDVANFEFLLPPKEQQAKLADLLWSSNNLVEREKDLLFRIKVLREVLFQSLVNTSKGNMKPLSKILIPQKSKSKVPHNRDKYIGLEHIHSGEFNCSEYSSTDDVLATCNIVNKSDLCYSKLRPYLDKAFISDFDAISTTELLIYDTQEVSKEYVLYHFHSRPFIDYVSGKSFGTKMPRTSHKVISEYEIKVCNNEVEILNRMEVLMNTQEQIKQKIESSSAFKKSLINQVF